MMNRLWTYDPGKTTGWAYWSLDTGELLDWGVMNTWEHLDRQIEPGDVVIYEKAIYKNPAFVPIGIEVIGVIKYLCNLHKASVIEQGPSEIGGVRKWPVYSFKHVKTEHAKDAICHGIIYYYKRKQSIVLPDLFLVKS